MTRLPDWQALFAAFLSKRRTIPFAWAENDCCTFAADGIKTMTGVDIAEDFRGYTTEAGAIAAIKRVCNGSTAADAVAYCATKYQIPEVENIKLAQRGDLLVVSNADQLIAGIVDLHGKAACVTDKGLHQFPISVAVRAYRV